MKTLNSSREHKPLGARCLISLLAGALLVFPLGMHVLAHFVVA